MTKRISLKYSSEVYFGHYHRRIYKAGPHDFGIEKIEAEKGDHIGGSRDLHPCERKAPHNNDSYKNGSYDDALKPGSMRRNPCLLRENDLRRSQVDFFGDRKNFGIDAGKFKSDDDVDLRWPDKDRIQAIANLMRLEMQTRIHAQMSCTRRHFFRLRVLNYVFPGKNVKHLGMFESGHWKHIVVQSGARGPGRLRVLCISGNESSMCCGSVDLGFSLEVKMIRRNPNSPPYILTWIIGIRYQNGGHGCTTSQEPRGNTSREERKTMKCLSYRLPVVAESSNGETLFLGASHELRSAE
ncbi:hypothetical protein EDD18DRAFT_1332522 [Armillaria luteobubalina]|uniref:Uncharacterized protein n=1 Tax=Armillaria luteobubalina TaxID=153913 RepID=A0AA39USQ6_9AGAR|nr:hypothetical protein EDD18DRAFT_1332522 [Armillaria luteobubalina]